MGTLGRGGGHFLIRLCWRVRVGEMCVCVYRGLLRWTVEWAKFNSLGKVLHLEQVQGKKGWNSFSLFTLLFALYVKMSWWS